MFLLKTYDSEQALNIGVGEDVSIAEFARLVADVIGYRGAIAHDPTKPDGTPRKLVDVTRLTGLGWRAQTPLRRGVELAYQHFLREGANRRER